MIEHHLYKFARAYHHLVGNCEQLMGRGHTEPTASISAEYRGFVIQHGLAPLVEEMERLNLNPDLSLHAKQLMGRMGQQSFRWTVELLASELLHFQQDLNRELHKHKFAYISHGKYFEQEKLFGGDVYNKIKEARQDLKDAGNCLAAGLYTACVFHLMRVAEHALRRLAKRVKPNLIHRGKPTPIEYETIEKICIAIDDKLKAAHTISAKPEKKRQLRLYADAAQHCLFMKDIWRNDVSHTGKPYIEAEALGAMDRVRDFAQFLARSLRTV
jgi:hypothetical protein